MNKADLYGRRDFLTEEGIRADVVMLCNIPHMTDEQEYVQGLISRKSSFHASVQHLANHELSSHHWEPGIWQRKLAETGAKVIVSYGVDSMPLRMVMPEGYFHSQQLRLSPGSGQYIMSSNYVESLPFSQWGNPALNRFIVESQKHDIPYGLDDGDVDTGQHHD